MRISIHLVARLLRLPILRIDGVIRLQDEESYPARVPTSPSAPVGRLLASAEADLARLDRSRRNGARPVVRKRAG